MSTLSAKEQLYGAGRRAEVAAVRKANHTDSVFGYETATSTYKTEAKDKFDLRVDYVQQRPAVCKSIGARVNQCYAYCRLGMFECLRCSNLLDIYDAIVGVHIVPIV